MTLGYTHAEDRGSRGQDSWPVTDRRPSIPTTESPDDSVLRGQAPVWPILLTSWSCPCSWLPRATPRLFGGFRKKSGWQRAHSSGIHIGTENCILSRGHVETWQPCPLSGAACSEDTGDHRQENLCPASSHRCRLQRVWFHPQHRPLTAVTDKKKSAISPAGICALRRPIHTTHPRTIYPIVSLSFCFPFFLFPSSPGDQLIAQR